MNQQRQFHLVIFGATGYTGRFAVEYLAGKPKVFHEGFKWAIAGRNSERLVQLKISLVEMFPYLAEVGSPSVLCADSLDSEALDRVTSDTKAAISCVGPYSKYGTPIVASCVRNGTHYADIAGEINWVRELITKFEEEAIWNKAVLVPSCGYGSMISDWGVWSIARLFRDKLGEGCGPVTNCVWHLDVVLSGGSWKSILCDDADEDERKDMENPHYMITNGYKTETSERGGRNFGWNPEYQTWTVSNVFNNVNARNVLRSASLNDYGSTFSYNEITSCKSWIHYLFEICIGFLFSLIVSTQWMKLVISRIIAAPGAGPKLEDLQNHYAAQKLIGRSAESGKVARCELVVRGNAGYVMTARMVVEAGVHLARQDDTTRDEKRFGFLTPSSALGEEYYEELQKYGFEIQTKLDPE